jgi:hypothetical protein
MEQTFFAIADSVGLRALIPEYETERQLVSQLQSRFENSVAFSVVLPCEWAVMAKHWLQQNEPMEALLVVHCCNHGTEPLTSDRFLG